jgi:hypothetical protein
VSKPPENESTTLLIAITLLCLPQFARFGADLSARVNDGSVGDRVREPLFWIPLSKESNYEIQREKSRENWQPRFGEASYKSLCITHVTAE